MIWHFQLKFQHCDWLFHLHLIWHFALKYQQFGWFLHLHLNCNNWIDYYSFTQTAVFYWLGTFHKNSNVFIYFHFTEISTLRSIQIVSLKLQRFGWFLLLHWINISIDYYFSIKLLHLIDLTIRTQIPTFCSFLLLHLIVTFGLIATSSLIAAIIDWARSAQISITWPLLLLLYSNFNTSINSCSFTHKYQFVPFHPNFSILISITVCNHFH